MQNTERSADELTKEQLGEGVRFERIRRITGYLVGTLERFNDGKAAEVNDRTTSDVYDDEAQLRAS